MSHADRSLPFRDTDLFGPTSILLFSRYPSIQGEYVILMIEAYAILASCIQSNLFHLVPSLIFLCLGCILGTPTPCSTHPFPTSALTFAFLWRRSHECKVNINGLVE